MKKTFTAIALAASLASTPAEAAFQVGWNKLYFFNCYTFVTITSPSNGLSGVSDVLWIFPDTTKTAGLTSNDTFATNDLTFIVQLVPFCGSGLPIFVHFINSSIWDAISVYPGLK